MVDGTNDPEELQLIRTCFVATADGDTVAAFVIDGRRYTDPEDVRRVYYEAWDEMERLGIGREWETHTASPGEPASSLPSWEEFRRSL